MSQSEPWVVKNATEMRQGESGQKGSWLMVVAS
jgi:hypothetical protein